MASTPRPAIQSRHTDPARRGGQRSLLLDLDGVLLDTRPVMQKAWGAVQQRHRIDVPFEQYEQHLGRPFNDIMRRLAVTDAEAVHQTYSEASMAVAHLARPFEGMKEVLHTLVARGWLLGVVTSKPLDRAAPLLAQLGCPFGSVRAAGGPGRSKPAPDPLLLALVDLCADPAQATFVGDMAVDHEAARRAGVAYVHAAWGYGSPGAPVPPTARAPKDLLQFLGEGRHSGPFLEGSLL
ncbi:HAD family hydrolase [Streptomyces hiroshimensis]|uniref:Phosphoglycolate phosphatase 2 n=1 Tax=Streptomyces hiroshimensis TaxID=66424 RepID=A0ABQ2Y8T2_9ACTN|nr:HAD-IA family hydrolase [Streptomyces hiroshimensis]GGX75884.1 phosphoglycolate phosphatase 2 [Streptomyces hiroshimensis]